MPFQVSLSVSLRNLRPISLQVIPSEIFNPCTDTVDLIATITSGVPNGHTFLWELLVGAQVLFTTPVNQLTASCSLLGVSTDRTFRFWVDKNRPTQQYFDLAFWGTITESTPLVGGNTLTTTGMLITNGSVPCSSIIGTQGQLVSDPTGSSAINPNNIILVWQLPSNTTGLVLLQVEQDIGGVWTTILSLLPTDPQILPSASQNTYYRIKTTYFIDGQYYVQYSCVYYLLIDLPTWNVYVDETIPNAGNSVVVNSLVSYTLITTDSITNELEELELLHAGNSVVVNSLVSYTLITTDSITNELEELELLHAGNSVVVTSVVYLGGTVIGGG